MELEPTTNLEGRQLFPTLKRHAGKPVMRGGSNLEQVPGAQLSPERSTNLQRALREINAAEMEVRGSAVIVYPNP